MGGYGAITIALKELISELQLSTSVIDYEDIVLGRFGGSFEISVGFRGDR